MRFLLLLVLLFTASLLFSACPQGDPSSNSAATPLVEEESEVGFSVKNMDLKADPRKDFTRYAIGGWLDRTKIPDDKLQITAANVLLDTLDKRLAEIARDAAKATGDEKTGNVKIVGDMYTSGMDMKKRDELGSKPLDSLLSAVDAAESPKQLAEIAARTELELGSSPFFSVEVGPDQKDRAVNSLVISSDVRSRGFFLNRNEYVDEGNQKIRDHNRDAKAKFFELTGDTPEAAKERAAKVLDFEKELAESTMTPVQASDPNATYNKMTAEELKAMIPAVDMDAYFAALGIGQPESVVISDPGSIKGLQKSLSSHSAEEVKSLLRSHIIWKTSGTLDSRFHDTFSEYQRVKYGLPKMPPMENEVVGGMGMLMAHPVSRLYVAKYFKPESRKAVVDMMDLIKAEFKNRIEANDWLTAGTKATAAKKLEKIQVKVGYPENDKDWIDYSSVKIAPDDFFGNVVRLREFNKHRNLSELGKPVEIDKFTVPGKVTPISMNAAIHQGFLVVYVTAAFIQPPYYVDKNDAAANFGSLGAVVGHELTHAFDSKGRNYDIDGNLNDWWTPEDAAEFKKRADVLVNQYNAYEVAPGVKVNGQLTLSENIADLGGMTLAYNALQTYMKNNGRLPDQDGLSPEQRFFVAWAQAWMAKSRIEALKIQVATDPHAPSEVRSFGPAVNMDSFYEAFGIKEGDPMWKAPADRVTIW